MNTLDKKYTDLLQDILDDGVKKEKEKNLLKRESVLNKKINFKFIIL